MFCGGNQMKWKTIAIIFIILFTLETLFIITIFKVGFDVQKEENVCSINICSEYNSYYYDSVESICYCYKNGEIKYQEYVVP